MLEVKLIFNPLAQAVPHPPLTMPGVNGMDMRSLLWFVLPSEVSLTMEGAENIPQAIAAPFTPKDYSNLSQVHQGHVHPLHDKHGSVRSGKLSKGITLPLFKLTLIFLVSYLHNILMDYLLFTQIK